MPRVEKIYRSQTNEHLFDSNHDSRGCDLARSPVLRARGHELGDQLGVIF